MEVAVAGAGGYRVELRARQGREMALDTGGWSIYRGGMMTP
jgi:hypothetical protein